IGMGREFKGIYNLYTDTIHIYQPGHRGDLVEAKRITGLDSDEGRAFLGDEWDAFQGEIELVRGASHAFELEAYLQGRQTPVFFGTALGNFGVEEMLSD